jgi:DnaJ-class molecular chaperone
MNMVSCPACGGSAQAELSLTSADGWVRWSATCARCAHEWDLVD